MESRHKFFLSHTGLNVTAIKDTPTIFFLIWYKKADCKNKQHSFNQVVSQKGGI